MEEEEVVTRVVAVNTMVVVVNTMLVEVNTMVGAIINTEEAVVESRPRTSTQVMEVVARFQTGYGS